jgi:hypothetical protein
MFTSKRTAEDLKRYTFAELFTLSLIKRITEGPYLGCFLQRLVFDITCSSQIA